MDGKSQMKKIILCVLILLVSVNVFATDIDITLLIKAANKKDANSQFQLAICYFNGEGVIQDDNQAIFWCQKAAEQGLVEAQFVLGECYQYGEGVPQNHTEAVKWYKLAAKKGYAPAQVNLGICYYYGYGVSLNPKKGVYWFQKAADQGDTLGQAFLGNDFTIGKGGPQNYQLAYMWYLIGLSLSTEADVVESFKAALINIEFRLTEAQIAEARQMAIEWKEKHK